MPRIPDHVIDAIQARADIAEWVGRYIPLKRAGRHFKALCPFHQERTPSFIVNTDKQIYHCFGCGAGGNVFGFLMHQEQLDFPEAVRMLAEQLGVPIPETSRADEQRFAKANDLLRVTETACKYFERVLDHPDHGKSVRAYVAKRGVSDEARKRFHLGLAREGWRHLAQAAQASGLSTEQLEAAGLVSRSDTGCYDRFRNRLIFAIQDVRGRVVGFGGRSLDDQPPKYLNSPETAVYIKGHHLFGLAQAREAMTATRRAVVVEGYFDCVTLVSLGIRDVVSPLGTALTPDQVRLLKRYVDRVVLAFDPDAAGESATLRGIELLLEAGLEVSVAKLPDGVDPDEYALKNGPAAMERLLEKSESLFDVFLREARLRHPGNRIENRVAVARQVLSNIAKVSDALIQREYVRRLAQTLDMEETAVNAELHKLLGRPAKERRRPTALAPTSGSTGASMNGSERLATALILDDPARAARVAAVAQPEHFRDAGLRALYERIQLLRADGVDLTAAQILSRLEDEGQSRLAGELLGLAETIDDKEAALEETLLRLRRQARSKHLRSLQDQLRQAQDAGRDEDVDQLLNEYQQQVKGG